MSDKPDSNRRRRRQKADGAVEHDDGVDRGDGRTIFGTFPDGKSGNVNGRPKGALNASTIARKVLAQTVTIKTKNGPQDVSKLEAAISQLLNCALADKNVRALERSIALGFTLEEKDASRPPAVPLGDADRAVLSLIAERLTEEPSS